MMTYHYTTGCSPDQWAYTAQFNEASAWVFRARSYTYEFLMKRQAAADRARTHAYRLMVRERNAMARQDATERKAG